jgi:hypothetical protein
MKKIRSFLSVVILLAFTSCTSPALNPDVSSKYSDQEIANLVQTFETSNNRDTIADDALLQKFKQDFPNAISAEWKTNNSLYEVEFEIKNHDWKAYYDKNGNLLMYKQEITAKELPENVKKAANTKLPKYHFEDIEKIVKGTETFYKIEMELKDTETTIFINSAGGFIK